MASGLDPSPQPAPRIRPGGTRDRLAHRGLLREQDETTAAVCSPIHLVEGGPGEVACHLLVLLVGLGEPQSCSR